MPKYMRLVFGMPNELVEEKRLLSFLYGCAVLAFLRTKLLYMQKRFISVGHMLGTCLIYMYAKSMQ